MGFLEEEPPRPMTKAARAKGEKLALAHFSAPPIDTEQLAEAQGIVVYRIELPTNVSGRGDIELQEIYINNQMHPNHQRFTLAHELGHFMLHHQTRRWTEFVSESSDKPLEQEANAFAGGLLMPGPFLKQFAKALAPKELAPIFQVSESALWIALLAHKLV